jgi:mono/diheme cytochrome c family protein
MSRSTGLFEATNPHRRALCAVVGALALIALSSPVAADETRIAEGHQLFVQYCASCHGREAQGNGPLAPILTTPPADLHMLSARHGAPLPKAQLAEWIDGRRAVRGHGPGDMPVWGKRLTASGPPGPAAETLAKGELMLIVDYIDSIQATQKQ